MKNAISAVSLATLISGVCVVTFWRVNSASALTTSQLTTSQTQPKRTKKVKVTIADAKGDWGSCSTSYSVGAKANHDVKVVWDRYGFDLQTDSGRTFCRLSNDLSFKNKQFAKFIIKKKVTLSDKNSSSSVSTSQIVTVRRGVRAVF